MVDREGSAQHCSSCPVGLVQPPRATGERRRKGEKKEKSIPFVDRRPLDMRRRGGPKRSPRASASVQHSNRERDREARLDVRKATPSFLHAVMHRCAHSPRNWVGTPSTKHFGATPSLPFAASEKKGESPEQAYMQAEWKQEENRESGEGEHFELRRRRHTNCGR